MKISWVILTYKREVVTNKSVYHNLYNCGREPEEIIWVDNGSYDIPRHVYSDKTIYHKENLGVAKGYNTGILNSSGSHIVITGCDRMMPHNWLKTYVECFEFIPNTGVISTYSKPFEKIPERFLTKKSQRINGIEILPSLPLEAKMVSRKVFKEIGYFREDFGLYGWEDVEWAYRANRVANEFGYLNYTLPGSLAQHLGSEGIEDWNGKDDKDYHEFKKKECEDPRKKELLEKCRRENWPYYNPYL